MRSGPQRAGPGADREQLRAAPRAGVVPWARGHRVQSFLRKPFACPRLLQFRVTHLF